MIKEDVDYNQMNGIALAYMGDAIYEIYIRRHLLAKGLTKPTMFFFLFFFFVFFFFLNDEELEFFKRGRNAKSHTSAKNTSVVTYRISTGFEALFGYLYLSDQIERLEELADWCINTVEKEGK